jgi:type VI protein secretion system component Hcp
MMMTRLQGSKDNLEALVTTTELSEAELEKATGGSQSGGSGAGKVTLNPFSVTRKIDSSSPKFF